MLRSPVCLPAPADHAHGLLTFIEHHKIHTVEELKLEFTLHHHSRSPSSVEPDDHYPLTCTLENGIWILGNLNTRHFFAFAWKRNEELFVLLSLLACLGCTERSVRLASTTITSTPRSVNDVEVHSIW